MSAANPPASADPAIGFSPDGVSPTGHPAAGAGVPGLLAGLRELLPEGAVLTGAQELTLYARDDATPLDYHEPLAVLLPETVEQVQAVLRLAHRHRVTVVPRGAGTGVSGGANATAGCIIVSLERMNRILELNAEDEVAVVEPGVINADLNARAAEFGLMYAPDPASYRISSIGGNIATNAGGLRCAKYGVTRDAVLALDVVLADGTLIHTGRRTFKGVAGYDLTGLFVGSEGTLGVVVGATVRLRHLPVDTRTICAYFPDLPAAAAGVLAVGRARIQPAIMELLDAATLQMLDGQFGSTLASHGAALLLIQTDGYGAGAEADAVQQVLAGLGALINPADLLSAGELLELRRHSRGAEQVNEYRVGEDVAVPRSRLVDYIAELERMAREHDVAVRVVAHAGDGNLHPTFTIPLDPAAGAEQHRRELERLDGALDESVRVALRMGGTITGEHGVGQLKVQWLPWEQQEEVMDLQRRIKAVLDPAGILNPGKAIA